MKTFWISIMAILGVFALSGPSALAMGRGSNVCEPYQARFCGGVLEQGHDKLVSCLRAHWDELSNDCKEVMTPITPPAQKNARAESTKSS